MNETKRKTPERGHIAQVYAVLSRNVGLPVSLDDLAQETGLLHQQVSQAIAGLRHRRNMDIEQVLAGVYRLRSFATPASGLPAPVLPAAPAVQRPTKRVFEEVGQAKSGLVIQDEKGVLYRAEEL